MSLSLITLIFFFYGLAFFTMGVAITLEIGRNIDAHTRLHQALRPLAAFGLLHGSHEWLEMFFGLGILPIQDAATLAWESARLGMLTFSFLSLGAFGAILLAPDEERGRLSLLAPLLMAGFWGFGLLILRGRYPLQGDLWDVVDVWTRYTVGIPSALLASAGLIVQQRDFRKAGMARFGQDSLWAAVAFAWYGVIGQLFTRVSPLPPSTVVNQDLFLRLFGFPVQLLRAATAIVAAIFVIRFLRSFEVEVQRQLSELQEARLTEAQRREARRGELLRRVVAAQEAERQRIARELHDETGQALTAIGLGLRGAGTNLSQDVEKAATNLRQLEGLVAHSLEELQHIIADLRPSHLDDLGLPAALRWYAGEVQNRVPLEVDVEIEGEPRPLPSAVNIALFRVVQEALTNVIKHADASQAMVALTFGNNSVSARVVDDGSGFDLGVIAMDSRPTWGLLGMQERASLMGGNFSIDSVQGRGTEVKVTLPYLQPEEASNDDQLVVSG